MTVEKIIAELRALSRPDQLQGMARYGINTETALAVRIRGKTRGIDIRAKSKGDVKREYFEASTKLTTRP